jgi:hypothetical protein
MWQAPLNGCPLEPAKLAHDIPGVFFQNDYLNKKDQLPSALPKDLVESARHYWETKTISLANSLGLNCNRKKVGLVGARGLMSLHHMKKCLMQALTAGVPYPPFGAT